MTDSEVGLYTRLLCAQWSRGGLPNNDSDLIRFSRGSTTAQPDLARVKLKFDLCEDGLLRNKRLEIEREKQIHFSASQSEKGKASAAARFNPGSTTVRKQLTPVQPSVSVSVSASVIGAATTPTVTNFNSFWEEYPKKKAKGDAERAFKSVIKFVELKTLLDAIKVQKNSDDWRKESGKFIPYPATWLNQKRWEDEATAVVCLPKNRGYILDAK